MPVPEEFYPTHEKEVKHFEWYHVIIALEDLRVALEQYHKQSQTQYQNLIKEFKKMAKMTEASFQEVLTEVNDVATAEDSLVAAVDLLIQQYADAPTEETKAAIMAKLEENKAKLLAAINNIPA